ncbi:MAG: TIGR00730 family Rossman fold protein [Sphaerochaetaceae bacterium]|nr:TIGR00730 family Rossman fold protein [Sphaerochaetaceae bacterium]
MEQKEPLRIIKNLCVFCGSSNGNNEIYHDAVVTLAQAMAQRSINLVYGGGGRGLMGIMAATLRDTPVSVTGIIPTKLYDMVKHIAHDEDELLIVSDMHEHKAIMYARSDAFIALPGGIGTLEEVMEALTWLQLGYHNKPVGLLNTNGYYDKLLEFLNHAVASGFLQQTLLETLIVTADASRLLEELSTAALILPLKIEQ